MHPKKYNAHVSAAAKLVGRMSYLDKEELANEESIAKSVCGVMMMSFEIVPHMLERWY